MPGFDSKRFIGLDDWLAKELECSVCLQVYDRAVDTNCGHTFCRDCIQQIVVNNRLVCPQCRHESVRKKQRSLQSADCLTSSTATTQDIHESLFRPNGRIDAIIGRLRTSCDFEDKGCDEVLELGHLSDHLEECNYNLCPDCGLKVGRRLDHKCLQLMKNERKAFLNTLVEYKVKINEFNKRVEGLETKNRELEEQLCRLSGRRVTTDDGITDDNGSPDVDKTVVNTGGTKRAANYGYRTPKKIRMFTKQISIASDVSGGDGKASKKSCYIMTSWQTFDDLVSHVAAIYDLPDPHGLTITFGDGGDQLDRTDTLAKLNIPSNKRTLKAHYNVDQNLVNIDL